MISALTQQRDLLLHQAEEQRLRWNSEKDSWARMAEALLAQQAKNRLNPERDEVSRRSVIYISVPAHEFRRRGDIFVMVTQSVFGLGLTTSTGL